MPDPRTRDGMPDLYAYARLLAKEKRRSPGQDVMSVLLAQTDPDGGRLTDAEFEEMLNRARETIVLGLLDTSAK